MFNKQNSSLSLVPSCFRWFFIAVLVAIVVQFALFGYALFKIASADFSNGVKPVIETVWCGKPKCMEESK